MKEHPDPNYSLRHRQLELERAETDGRIAGELLVVNEIVDIALVPDPGDLAAVVAENLISVVPSPDGRERVETVGDVDDQRTIFWIPAGAFNAILAEVKGLEPLDGPYVYLDDLGDGSLARFLRNDVGRAGALSPYVRRVLCLGTGASS